MILRELKELTAALGDEFDFLEVVIEKPAADWKREAPARVGAPLQFRVHHGAYVALEARA